MTPAVAAGVRRYRARHPQRVRDSAKERQRRRRDIIQKIKLERGCVDCGYNTHPAALDFDHRRGEPKVKDVSKLLTNSMEKLLAEIAKCDVVCANCHRIRTSLRQKGE